MSKELTNKILVIGVVFLFSGLIFIPSINGLNSFDDITPPNTTISLDPPEPNGLNGWYISDVDLTLSATDDKSGVKTIYYKMPEEQWKQYDGDTILIILDYDCLSGFIEYYSEDNAGNFESIKSYEIFIDQKEPEVDLTYDYKRGNQWQGWEFIFTATAIDYCSGVDRAEFYLNDALKDTVYGSGPEYIWKYKYLYLAPPFRAMGLIINPEVTEKFVNFFAIFVIITGSPPRPHIYVTIYDKAGNSATDEIMYPTTFQTIIPGLYIFRTLTLPNNYQGHIGNFFILAEFQ